MLSKSIRRLNSFPPPFHRFWVRSMYLRIFFFFIVLLKSKETFFLQGDDTNVFCLILRGKLGFSLLFFCSQGGKKQPIVRAALRMLLFYLRADPFSGLNGLALKLYEIFRLHERLFPGFLSNRIA